MFNVLKIESKGQVCNFTGKSEGRQSKRLCPHIPAQCQMKSQPWVYHQFKRLYKRAAQVKKYKLSILHLEKWSIHFDGK